MNIFQVKNLRRYFSAAVLLMLLNTVGIAQDNVLDQIRTSFDNYQAETYQEKVFIHTDRDLYLAGELLWFKSYLTSGSDNMMSKLSKVVYIELIDKDKEAVLHTKVESEEGLANGSVFLPVTLASGNYILRAYTNWMKNFSADLFFEKQLTIINSLSPDPPAAISTENYDIQFFPEGGTMLAGVENKVAFRVAGSNGSGLDFQGLIVDERNDTLLRFQPLKFGIGNFVFTPQQHKTYRALIRMEGDPKEVTKDLPQVYSLGYNMRVEKLSPSRLSIKVASGQNIAASVYLIVHSRQKISVAERGILTNGQVSFSAGTDQLADGVSYFTIFDSNFKPLAERLYFKRPQRKLNVKVLSDKGQYPMRSKVDIEIMAVHLDQPSQADLSLAVFRTDSLNRPPKADIFSYQWLTSELKGNIENPDYYLEEGNPESDAALDNLMLTHGWRKFQWTDVFANEEKEYKFLPEFEGHIIEGKITDTRTGAPAEGIMTFLSIPSKRTQIYTSRSDQDGRIRFFTWDMYGPGEIVVQTDVMKDSTYQIEIDNPFSEKMSGTLLPPFRIPDVPASLLEERHVSTQVQNVFAADELRNFISPHIDSTAFYGKPEYVYLLDDYVRFRTTEEVLREYVPAVIIFRQRTDFSVVVDKRTARGLVGSVPLLILDGVPIFDRGNKMMAYDPEKLWKLEVSTQNSFLGDTSFNSIVNFTSFKGNLESFELDPHDIVLDYEGLQLQREFFSPVYETESQRSSRLPDQRQLLYWSPEVKTGAEGNSSISFYTSDLPGRYQVVIQGLSSGGDAGSGTAYFEVK